MAATRTVARLLLLLLTRSEEISSHVYGQPFQAKVSGKSSSRMAVHNSTAAKERKEAISIPSEATHRTDRMHSCWDSSKEVEARSCGFNATTKFPGSEIDIILRESKVLKHPRFSFLD